MLPLTGFTIGVTADRRADEQAELLRRKGAEVVLGPVIRTLPLTDGPELAAATEALVAEPPDVLVAVTGLGVRSWFEAADGRGRGDALRDALAGATRLARGPKAAGALATVGLDAHWRAPAETTAEVVEHLGADLTGRRVAVQRDGAQEAYAARELAARGAAVVDVPVYRWLLPDDPGPATSLLTALVGGQLDVVTFTSAAAISNLFALADEHLDGGATAVVEVLRGPVVPVCVGPVSAARLAAHGVEGARHPDRWRLGPMVRCVTDALGGRHRTVVLGGVAAEVQGTAVAVTGADDVRLSRREAQLLGALVEAGGTVCSKEQLARTLWEPGADPHVVEVTVGRLRRRLGPAGAALQTVPRRGYRVAS